MRKISDTIARLSAMQARGAAHTASRGPDRLRPFAFSGPNPGALAGKVHVPANLPHDAPLVLVLHCCTQTAGGYDHHSGWSKLADEAGFALLFPEQQRANNPNLCFNWFLSADASRDAGEALSIRRMIASMIEAHPVDPRRVFVTGLSAGGAMAASLLASYPEVFAGGAIVAGLPHGVASTIPEAFDRMRGHGGPSEERLKQILRNASAHQGPWPTVSIWHGSADQTVAVSNADAVLAQWRGVHRLCASPTSTETLGRRSRRTWRDGSGKVVAEVNIIAGMGHGTPLGGDGLGTAGPFMLDVGVSSTREIARFWGIAAAPDTADLPHRPASDVSVAARQDAGADGPSPEEPRSTPPRPDPSPDPSGIRKTIEDALRSAGLMR